MKRKIVCFILAVILLLVSLPLSVLANEVRYAGTTGEVLVTSKYFEKLPNSDEIKTLPDENGVFWITISLSNRMIRGEWLEIDFEIENGTAEVGTVLAEDGTVLEGDYLGAFADPSHVELNYVDQEHVGTKGTIIMPFNIGSIQLKVYSNVLNTNEDKTFTFRLTGVRNHYTNFEVSETQDELTCHLRTSPTVTVSSVYSQQGRAVPDESGTFYFDISLDWKPINGDEILVYYRTIDDSAVAAWGDYEAAGHLEDAYVTLNQANNYTARVTVRSTVLDDAFYVDFLQENPREYVYSRKFIFELRYVEGNAMLVENDPQTPYRLDCHLKADRYHQQNNSGVPRQSTIVSIAEEQSISTPWCPDKSWYEGTLNFTFPDYFKDYVDAGFSDVGIAIYGDCLEDWWNSDGPATFHLYYYHEGTYKKAVSLYMEGEFDSSTFFGWELAFDYMAGNYSQNGNGVNIDAYMKNNFIGFTIYDNDENVAFTTLTADGQRGSNSAICEKLQGALQQGIAKINEDPYYGTSYTHGKISDYYMTYMKLPSNFVLADSYRYVFESDTDGKKRKLDHVAISFYLMGIDDPKIATDESGVQMISTNIDQLKEGDPLRMSIRFDQPVRVEEPYTNMGGYESVNVIALINGEYPVTLYYTGAGNTLDTLVFEGEFSEWLDNVKIHSLTSIKLVYAKTNGIKAYLTGKALQSKKIYDIYNRYDTDLRTPVTTVSISGTDGRWTKSKSVDVYVWEENKKSRFMDYVTVYYEWSSSPRAPEIYSHKLIFHTAQDHEVMKTIVGTGNGKMFLHIKTVSRYGKETTETIGAVEVNGNIEGAYLFDNAPPSLTLTEDTFNVSGALSAPAIRINAPLDDCGWQTMELYRKGDTKPFKVITRDDFEKRVITFEAYEALAAPESYEGLITFEDGKQPQYTFTIQAADVGVGLDGKMERKEMEFYWILSDRLGNVSEETARFSLIFDTNDYLNENEIISVGPYDRSTGDQLARFGSTTEKLDDVTYIYDYSKNQGKAYEVHSSGKSIYYAFYFQIDRTSFDGGDLGNYTVSVKHRGTPVSEAVLEAVNDDGLYVVWFHQEMESGQYEIQLIRTENDSVRVSRIYSVYATDGEADDTPGKVKVEIGTLLVNTVYQLSSDDPYFYYMDEFGVSQKQYYNNTKQPASFSGIAKAKEYVYYMELNDVYLVQLTAITATALNTNTPGYLKAQGESTVAQEGDYWIRYKSATWVPGSNKNSWVYYYYGKSGELNEASFSTNLKNALNSVANRIVGYGKSVILTDTSLLLGTVTGDKMLDKYGMPYLYDGQVHAVDESSYTTLAGSVWSIPVVYAADKNIYRSNMYVGEEGSEAYREYPLVGNFTLSEDSRFQYVDYGEFGKGDAAQWRPMNLKAGETFVDFFKDSGIYYIREISKDGVAVYPICIDKASPSVEFYYYDLTGTRRDFAVDGVEIQEINVREIIIGNIFDTDRLSYISVYNSQLNLVAMHNAEELAVSPLKLENGKYYIVVSDRSGNHYTVTAKVSNTSLQCLVKESTDRFIKLTCNRRDDEILRYEVYLNGQLLTSAYSADQNFTSSGTYHFLIQDIYGNTFNAEKVFYRNYPEVTWKYRGEDGKYHVYDPDSAEANGFIMTPTTENQYKISTSVETRFSFSGSYTFKFIGTTPKYTQTVTTETTVTIEAGQSFTLKVYYKDFPENYVTFSGVVDVTPPTVNVLAETNVPRNGEYSLFDRWLANGRIGDVIDLEELYYVAEKERKIISDGETVSSGLIKIDVSDANNLYFVEVYLDGEMIKRQDAKTGFSQIVVSRWGKYRIVAKDALGNVSEVSFTNGQPEHFDYLVDGEEREFELDAYLDFETVDGKKVYAKSEYGNSALQLDLKQNADVFLSVGMTDGGSKIYGFRIQDGNVYPLVYTIVERDGVARIDLQVGAALLSTAADDFAADKEYALNKDGRHEIYASASKQGLVTVKVYAPEDTSKVVAVSARLEFTDNHTMFVSTKLSKKASEITFKDTDGNEIVGFLTGTDIRANRGFTIDEQFFASEFVSDIKLYYSKLNDLAMDSLKQRKNIYESGGRYDAEGFYLLVVRNRFGNERVYRIAISRSFGITSSVTFGDGEKNYYSKNYNEKLYSNNEIILDILDENVSYAVTRNGVAYDGFEARIEDGITYLVFSEEGSYEVILTDSYGNEIVRQLEIDRSDYSMADDLLTGYNDKALKRDEGYTNWKLTVSQAVFEREGIYYLAIKYGETVTVLFDAFSETATEIRPEGWVDIIGSQGDGVYTVIGRNRYGAIVTKEIHYRSTPTLKLERTTRSKTEPEAYDLSEAASLGFWSNNSLIFSTEATAYVFTINGNVTECPRTLVFESAGEYGSTEYEITYIDEYGFEYRFTAYLVRKDVAIHLAPSVTGMDVNGVLNTKNDIFITLDENTYATYTLNNGAETLYRSGDILKKDGTYKFTVMDYAGNAASLTVKKDTIVEFAFLEANTGAVIQNGSVVNSSKIDFDALNKDSAYIERVLRNGAVQADFAGSRFTEDGKWEVILRDQLGNEAYFSFYIVTHAQNGFAYTTPYESHITEMWYDGGDGVRVSYMTFVTHTDVTSSFDFKENGTYTVVMASDVTGAISTFKFTVNTNPPEVSLVGCSVGETTINDVTLAGYKIGDRISVYRETQTGEEMVAYVEVTSLSTKIPTITEGGKYRIVVEGESGVATELCFVRKHVMNTAGSIFIMVVIGLAVVGLFTGLVYRNKSKTDD